MVGLNFNVEAADYLLFRSLVGERKVAQTLRNYIKSYASTHDLNETILKKRFEILSAEKQKLDAEYFGLKDKLDAIEGKRKAEELELLEAEKRQEEINRQSEYETLKANLAEVVRM